MCHLQDVVGPPHSSAGESPWGRRGCNGCKRNLRGGTPSCPQGRPQIRTSPLPKPLSYSFTHPHFSSTGGKTPNTPKPRPKTPQKQDPKHPSQAAPQKQGHKPKSYLTAPTRRRKHQAPTQTLSFYLMSQLSSSWSQLAQVPPSSSLSPWHSRGAVGTDPTRNKQWGLGCLGENLGPPHPSHQAETGLQCWKMSRAL